MRLSDKLFEDISDGMRVTHYTPGATSNEIQAQRLQVWHLWALSSSEASEEPWRGGGRFVSSDSPLGFPELELIESGLGSGSFHYGHFMRGIQMRCLNLKWNSVFLRVLRGWMGGIKRHMCSSEIRYHMVRDQLGHINPSPLSEAVCSKKITLLLLSRNWTHKHDMHIFRYGVT